MSSTLSGQNTGEGRTATMLNLTSSGPGTGTSRAAQEAPSTPSRQESLTGTREAATVEVTTKTPSCLGTGAGTGAKGALAAEETPYTLAPLGTGTREVATAEEMSSTLSRLEKGTERQRRGRHTTHRT